MSRILVLVFVAAANYLSAQKIAPAVIANAGAVMKSGNFSLEWTLGEVITETRTASNLKITQGFHQANLGSTSIDNFNFQGIEVYPNPASSVLVINNTSQELLNYTLNQIDGKQIQQSKLAQGTQELQLGNYAIGTYLLIIRNERNEQEIFKIEKIK